MIFAPVSRRIDMRTRRGASYWPGPLGNMIDQFRPGDIVDSIVTGSSDLWGVVVSVDRKCNKVVVAWAGGSEVQHDPDEIQPALLVGEELKERMRTIATRDSRLASRRAKVADPGDAFPAPSPLRSRRDLGAGPVNAAMSGESFARFRKIRNNGKLIGHGKFKNEFELDDYYLHDGNVWRVTNRSVVNQGSPADFEKKGIKLKKAAVSIGEPQADDPQYVGDPKTHGLDAPRGGGFSIMQNLQKDLHEESYEESGADGRVGSRRASLGLAGRSTHVHWGRRGGSGGKTFGSGAEATYSFEDGDKKLRVYVGKDVAGVDDSPDRTVGVASFAEAMDASEDIERDLQSGRVARMLTAKKKTLRTTVEDNNGQTFVATLESGVKGGVILRLREKTGATGGTWTWRVSTLMGLDGWSDPVGDKLALDAGRGWYVTGMSRVMDEVEKSVRMEPVLASRRDRKAMYWCSPERTYRLTKGDQEAGTATCPSCGGEMAVEPYTRSEKMWRCGDCGFKVPSGKAVTRKVEIEIEPSGEMEVEVVASLRSRRSVAKAAKKELKKRLG